MSQIPEINPEGWSDLPVESVGYPQQDYPQYYNQQQPGPAAYPNQQQPGPAAYANQQPGPAVYAADPDNVPVLSEFDHLFRDSDPDSRRSVVPQNSPIVRVSGDSVYVVTTAPALTPPPQAAALPAPTQQYSRQESEQLYDQYAQQPAQQYQQQAEQQYQQQPEQVYDQYQLAPQYPLPPEQQQFEQTTYLPQTPAGNQAGYETQTAYQPGPPHGDPGEQQWLAGDGGGKSKRPLLIGGGVAALVVIGLIFAFTSNGSNGKAPTQPIAATTPAALTAAQQAAQLTTIVGQSAALRSAAISAVSDLSSATCSQLAQDQTSLQATAKARSAQAAAVAALNVSKLPGGSELVSDLSQAWEASASSDTAYAKIAGDLAASNVTNCKSSWKKDPNFSAADSADGTATHAKAAAAVLWNSDLTAAPISQAAINANDL